MDRLAHWSAKERHGLLTYTNGVKPLVTFQASDKIRGLNSTVVPTVVLVTELHRNGAL